MIRYEKQNENSYLDRQTRELISPNHPRWDELHLWLLQNSADELPKHTQSPDELLSQKIAEYNAALIAHLDEKARERQYDNRITCALRAGFVGPFQSEGQAFAIWMDICNANAYQLLADVRRGERALPSIEAFISELPPLVWP